MIKLYTKKRPMIWWYWFMKNDQKYNISELCRIYKVTPKTIYNWRWIYKKHQKELFDQIQNRNNIFPSFKEIAKERSTIKWTPKNHKNIL